MSPHSDLVIISREEFPADWVFIPGEFSPTIAPLVLHSSSSADWDGELTVLGEFLSWNYHVLENKLGDIHFLEIGIPLPSSSHVLDVDLLSINLDWQRLHLLFVTHALIMACYPLWFTSCLSTPRGLKTVFNQAVVLFPNLSATHVFSHLNRSLFFFLFSFFPPFRLTLAKTVPAKSSENHFSWFAFLASLVIRHRILFLFSLPPFHSFWPFSVCPSLSSPLPRPTALDSSHRRRHLL